VSCTTMPMIPVLLPSFSLAGGLPGTPEKAEQRWNAAQVRPAGPLACMYMES
jgi:hypothetical protein